MWVDGVSGSKSRGRNDDLPRESSWRNAVHSLTPSGERWQTEGVNRGIALGLAVALITSGYSGGSDSAELRIRSRESADSLA